MCTILRCNFNTQVHDEGENAAALRGKNSLPTSGKLIGAAIKPRAVLGDICNTRTALNNVVSKADASENEFKKPHNLPSKSVAKKHVQESER